MPRRLHGVQALVAALGVLLVAGAQGAPVAAGARQPLAGGTLVFCRAQAKYDLGGNYMRRWTDRPLLQNSALRERGAGEFTSLESWRRIVETGRSYGLDGFAFFPETVGRAQLFELTDRLRPQQFHLLPEFISTPDVAAKRGVLKAALECKSCVRINGRIPITGYRTDSTPLATWRRQLDGFRREFGEAFIFLPDLEVPGGQSWGKWLEAYRAGRLTEADQERIRASLREWLTVFDGLYFAAAASLKANRRFEAGFYREVLIPACCQVLGEPGFQGKYFALSAMIGHENCTRLGYTLSHDGTKTLRRSFEAALEARPDLIVLPEWDEQNENTSLRPTVYNSFSTRRILRYYTQRLRGQAPAPCPGDDPAVPNLVVSYRKILSLGEVLEFELLNVPDGSAREPYQVTLALEDLEGRTVASFSEVSIAPGELADQTLRIASETLADCPVLRPSLTIRQGARRRVFKEGLHHVHLRATWNWDYKWVKLPLRDLCVPVAARFDGDQAPHRVRGLVECDSDLASVEVLDDDDVVYAADPGGQGLRDRAGEVLLGIEMRSFDRVRMRGSITVRNSPCTWPAADWIPVRHTTYKGNRLAMADNVDWQLRQHFLSLPVETAAQAVLDCDFDRFKTSIPVKQVLAGEVYSETHGRGTTLTVCVYHRQPDHPPHLNRRRVEFAAAVAPDSPASVYHLRAVTTEGRIYCSRPRLLPPADPAARAPLVVWSDTRRAPVRVAVHPSRIPDIDYAFDPSRGAALWTSAGRAFWGHLGGLTDSVTLRGGDGGRDGSPFVRGTVYPQAAAQMAPAWVKEDGADCLAFDGIGNFIALPQGVLPRRGSFRLIFEIKPAGAGKQVLFSHVGNYIGSLTVGLEHGKLGATFTGEHLQTVAFKPGLEVPCGQWSQIELIYDLDGMRFRVNGTSSDKLPCRGPGLYDTTSVFGGFGDPGPRGRPDQSPGWFKGHLRRLRVVHNAIESPPTLTEEKKDR